MRSALLSCLLLLGAAAAASQPAPEGSPFAVILNEEGDHYSAPAFAFDAQGNHAAVWERFRTSGDPQSDVFVRRYDAAGNPLGPALQVNVESADFQNDPRIAMNDQGRFVVAWTSYGQDGDGSGVYARVWSGGQPVGGELRVNTFTTGPQQDPDVGMSAEGEFVVVWESRGQGADGRFGIFARLFDAAGDPLSPEIRVDLPSGRNARIPRLAVWPDGRFVVLWSRGLPEGGAGVFARLFDRTGSPATGEILLAGDTSTPYLGFPAVAVQRDGFAAAWDFCGDDGTCAISGRRFDAAGQPLAGEILVSPAGQRSSIPAVAFDSRGAFAVSWRQCLPGPVQFSNCSAQVRFFDPQGIPLGADAVRWSNNLSDITVAAVGTDFLLAWDAASCVGFSCSGRRPEGIYAQRYRLEVPPAGDCVLTEEVLCLNRGRFRVEADFRLPDGTAGTARAVPLTADSGYLWFFGKGNIELLVKVVNGCARNSRFWVFAGGLTNVEVDLKVTDTETGVVRTYTNPQGTRFLPIQDTAAFQGCPDTASAVQPLPETAEDARAAPAQEIFCFVTDTSLCLGDARFRVEASWRTRDGATGRGRAVQLTPDSGTFWFFSPDNVELVVKSLNGCTASGGAHWVFAAGLTNVEVEIRVTDVRTGTEKIYRNRQGRVFQPIQDTRAFPSCP